MPEWLVKVKDNKDVDRAPYYPEHMRDLPSLVDGGIIVVAGALTTPEGKEIGGMFIVTAKTKEEAIEIVKRDVFARKGIFNMDSVTCERTIGIRTARSFEPCAKEFESVGRKVYG
ncbi:hypothetical protein KAFR_0D02400 [Kazachstania africana CBS 2517]|uniref:YCII-related domain-containing protein n=1 Tax=Kazachstania africana (strain ATCC 22294 / BCRC 22015 / CBS 2517 / CECT 1963 / NBRC 1671 / NRRL Y-8276) TaxID=1071382 RepID=H2AU37_KAZAF|nr:hypothetical protein KAFR_0D02400 [Kazachstania africana CBS 2517]CCF57887.1 hypothetical protein KAFR_0D02400 [Kazachstania africana CBS 2517]